jgi:hypothetical protein
MQCRVFPDTESSSLSDGTVRQHAFSFAASPCNYFAFELYIETDGVFCRFTKTNNIILIIIQKFSQSLIFVTCTCKEIVICLPPLCGMSLQDKSYRVLYRLRHWNH